MPAPFESFCDWCARVAKDFSENLPGVLDTGAGDMIQYGAKS